MASEDLFKEFIEKVKKDKSPEELAKFLADLYKFGSAEVYFTMLAVLEEEDMAAIDKIQDPAFSTAVGLMQWGTHFHEKNRQFSLGGGFSSIGDATQKMQKWFKSLLP